MNIFIDTSAFIRHFYGVDDAIKLLYFAVNENEAVTAHNVIVLIANIRSGIIGLLDMKEEIISDFVEIAFDYTMLPNDALIAATCKYPGIRKIITFDSDFESVEFTLLYCSLCTDNCSSPPVGHPPGSYDRCKSRQSNSNPYFHSHPRMHNSHRVRYSSLMI